MHLGADIAVPTEYIVAILNAEATKRSVDSLEYIQHAKKQDRLYLIDGEEQRSYIIIFQNGKEMVYSSPIAPETLQKRSQWAGF